MSRIGQCWTWIMIQKAILAFVTDSRPTKTQLLHRKPRGRGGVASSSASKHLERTIISPPLAGVIVTSISPAESSSSRETISIVSLAAKSVRNLQRPKKFRPEDD